MARYVVRRLGVALSTLGLVVAASFLMVRLAPGDPAEAFADEVRLSDEQLTRARHALGLDRPVPLQFAAYLGRLLRGDLGRSYFSQEPVGALIRSRLRFTLELALAAHVLSVAIGIPLGLLAAVRRDSWLDHLAMTSAVALHAMPRFWIGLALLLVFALRLPWFPVIGAGSPGDPLDRLHHLVLPAMAVALTQAALLARVTRAGMLEALSQDFVRTARGKGLAPRHVLIRHGLRSALPPVATVAGLGLGRLLGGSVVIETVFVRPGIGTLLVEAMRSRDYPVVQGAILIFAVGIVVLNAAVDLLYPVFDPRVRS
ncbi:MAG: ABC transporter permease [Armatimonadota bacterium]|nr:ABC transporter permease [Armatimonadota bacterium]